MIGFKMNSAFLATLEWSYPKYTLLFEQQRLGFVATVCAMERPNVSPKGAVCVLEDDRLRFTDIWSPGIVASLRANPRVEVNVVDPFVRKGSEEVAKRRARNFVLNPYGFLPIAIIEVGPQGR